ncbi:hypothetical protein DFH08DRAFT_827270 [Mycena albidolilacea]|uniref:Uncharacterized protein n=1 Tax=Mycena albidolilacea TaxID=1033008 RepID=A0AAD6YZL7_9AGAR|nr:hypothetical protein DFH08DRAFT_827270 [Mycena albidolilacea]
MSGCLIGLFSPNVPKMPPVPSRTPAARRLACARYREKKKEELAEKSRIKMKEYLAVLLPCYAAHINLRYRQRIQDDPVHAQEYQERKKAGNNAYQQKNGRLLAYKKREQRLENATKKLGHDKACKKACERQRSREQGRDYELAILQEKHQDEIQMKVADAMWSPGSSRGSRYQHEDGLYSFRGDNPNTTKATAKVFYLITSPAAGSKCSVYPSWTSTQRASEGSARGDAVKFMAWDDCLPAWHACCDAGEHEHDALPPRTPTPPTTPTRPPRAAPSSVPPSPTYAVCGSGAIHSSLDAALADFQAAATRGPVTFYTAEDPRVAAHVAAGRSPEDAIALVSRSFVEGEAASGSSSTRPVAVRRRVVEQLSEALAALVVDPSEMAGGNVSYDHTVPLTGLPYENDNSDDEY